MHGDMNLGCSVRRTYLSALIDAFFFSCPYFRWTQCAGDCVLGRLQTSIGPTAISAREGQLSDSEFVPRKCLPRSTHEGMLLLGVS